MQDQGSTLEEKESEVLDPDSHLFFISSYEMPQWHWSQERGTFERFVRNLSIESQVHRILSLDRAHP
jgi:DNA polymerase epsilon subunit 2